MEKSVLEQNCALLEQNFYASNKNNTSLEKVLSMYKEEVKKIDIESIDILFYDFGDKNEPFSNYFDYIRGSVELSDEKKYVVKINSLLSYKQIIKTMLHELLHIMRRDVKSGIPCYEMMKLDKNKIDEIRNLWFRFLYSREMSHDDNAQINASVDKFIEQHPDLTC
jgi:hypothetical protein